MLIKWERLTSTVVAVWGSHRFTGLLDVSNWPTQAPEQQQYARNWTSIKDTSTILSALTYSVPCTYHFRGRKLYRVRSVLGPWTSRDRRCRHGNKERFYAFTTGISTYAGCSSVLVHSAWATDGVRGQLTHWPSDPIWRRPKTVDRNNVIHSQHAATGKVEVTDELRRKWNGNGERERLDQRYSQLVCLHTHTHTRNFAKYAATTTHTCRQECSTWNVAPEIMAVSEKL